VTSANCRNAPDQRPPSHRVPSSLPGNLQPPPPLVFYTDPDRAAFEATLFEDPRSQSIAWAGSGHWLHQERPVEFNTLVDTWLASL